MGFKSLKLGSRACEQEAGAPLYDAELGSRLED